MCGSCYNSGCCKIRAIRNCRVSDNPKAVATASLRDGQLQPALARNVTAGCRLPAIFRRLDRQNLRAGFAGSESELDWPADVSVVGRNDMPHAVAAAHHPRASTIRKLREITTLMNCFTRRISSSPFSNAASSRASPHGRTSRSWQWRGTWKSGIGRNESAKEALKPGSLLRSVREVRQPLWPTCQRGKAQFRKTAGSRCFETTTI